MPKHSWVGKQSKSFTNARSNAAGYAKRKSLKSKPLTNPSSDVYEYQQDRVRRGKVKLQLEKDEITGTGGGDGSGSDDDDEEEGGQHRTKNMRPRLVGELDGDDQIDEEDDEELDSDGAFDESDEERFAGFDFSRGKKSTASKTKISAKSVRFSEVDLDEDENDQRQPADDEGSCDEEGGTSGEEEEEGDADEFIDVLDILDGRGEALEDEGESTALSSVGGADGNEAEQTGRADFDASDIASDEDSDAEHTDHHSSSSDDAFVLSASEDEAGGDTKALRNLETFITTLDAGQKRKAPGDDSSSKDHAHDARPMKRRILKEQAPTGEENEFVAFSGSTKLNLDDLIAPLATSSSSGLHNLKKSAKVLLSSSSKSRTLSAPLPQRTQERLDRQAAYDQTKEEINKWSTTMQHIKDAEHLSFPLQAQSEGKPSNLELTAKFKPTTELESAVDKLLKSARMREMDIAQTEALKMNHLSVEDVAERRAELAKMRELMFRAEAKAKRIAKIKSKTYRRIKKKEKSKLAVKLGGLNDDDDESMMRREVERAKERATLRHKNTGQWAKAMKARGELNEDQRKDINEMLDRGEQLRKRIQGKGSDGESDDDDEDEDDDLTEGAIDRIKSSAFDELARLQDRDVESAGNGNADRSVFEMKFMKDAMAREKRRADQMADDFAKELGDDGLDANANNEGSDLLTQPSAVISERGGGRVSFRPGIATARMTPRPSLAASDTSSVTLKSTDLLPDGNLDIPMTISPTAERPVPLPENHSGLNPWLVPRDAGQPRALQKKHEVVIAKESGAVEKAKHKLRKRAQQREAEKAKAKEDAVVEVSTANSMGVLASTAHAGPPKPQQAKPRREQVLKTGDSDSDYDSEIEEQEDALLKRGQGRVKGAAAFEQRDLVARAFAGDNVVRDFTEEKRREMQEDAPKEVDTTLPGWGSWGGTGTRKTAPKQHLIKKIVGVNPQSRADYGKAHVIISEKRDKKAAKYLVKDLPYPYTSKAQFERSMSTPIGTEWNTRVGFQRGTLPKVVKKMGTVITPLEKLT